MFKKRFKRVFMRRLAKELQTIRERVTIRVNGLIDMDACILHGADAYGDCVMIPVESVEHVVTAWDVKSAESGCVAFRVEVRDKSDNVYACVYIPETYMKNATRRICVQDAKQLCDNYIQGVSKTLAQTYIEEKENKNHD